MLNENNIWHVVIICITVIICTMFNCENIARVQTRVTHTDISEPVNR